jgi:archaellum component FlaC
MITSKIAANQAFVQTSRISKNDDANRQNTTSEETIRMPSGEEVDGIKAEISTFSAHPLQKFNAEFNAVVKSIRIADKAMGEIETNIEQMESEVEMFIKQYPPFPPGSEDRIKYLSRFAMLRKQIDQLTFPPDAGAQTIMGQSSQGHPNAWEIKIGGMKSGQSIRTHSLHAGQGGLGIPEITPQANDGQVHEFKKSLDAARQTVVKSRAELAEDAFRMIRSAE